jgi:hypothetical protein
VEISLGFWAGNFTGVLQEYYSSFNHRSPTGALQEFYRNSIRVLQELHRSPTGVLQEAHRSFTGLPLELYRSFAKALCKLQPTRTLQT